MRGSTLRIVKNPRGTRYDRWLVLDQDYPALSYWAETRREARALRHALRLRFLKQEEGRRLALQGAST